MITTLYSTGGQELREFELDDSVFGAKLSQSAIYYAVNNELANQRVGTASTKGRGEVKGSGAKPWPQKGTGRARAGDRKSPIWVGGGTIFGPKPRDFSYKMPKKLKRMAYRSLLSMKASGDELRLVEDFSIETGKTKDLVSILANLGQNDGTPQRTVLVLGDDDAMSKRAGNNIPWLLTQSYNRLSAHALFYGKRIIVTESAATKLAEFYGRKS